MLLCPTPVQKEHIAQHYEFDELVTHNISDICGTLPDKHFYTRWSITEDNIIAMGLPGDATCMDIIIQLKLGDTCNDAEMYRWASEMTD